MAKKDTTKPGWNIPVDIKEEFSAFCGKVASLAQESCAGALFIWQYLPPQIRELTILQAKGEIPVDKKFWETFRAGLEVGIQAQLYNQKQKQGQKNKKK